MVWTGLANNFQYFTLCYQKFTEVPSQAVLHPKVVNYYDFKDEGWGQSVCVCVHVHYCSKGACTRDCFVVLYTLVLIKLYCITLYVQVQDYTGKIHQTTTPKLQDRVQVKQTVTDTLLHSSCLSCVEYEKTNLLVLYTLQLASYKFLIIITLS